MRLTVKVLIILWLVPLAALLDRAARAMRFRRMARLW